jgi:hypothetical protein
MDSSRFSGKYKALTNIKATTQEAPTNLSQLYKMFEHKYFRVYYTHATQGAHIKAIKQIPIEGRDPVTAENKPATNQQDSSRPL